MDLQWHKKALPPVPLTQSCILTWSQIWELFEVEAACVFCFVLNVVFKFKKIIFF